MTEQPSPDAFLMPVLGSYKDSYKWAVYLPDTEAIRRQADRNHSQTLERLRERGGLAWMEMFAVLNEKHWSEVRHLDSLHCQAEIRKLGIAVRVR